VMENQVVEFTLFKQYLLFLTLKLDATYISVYNINIMN
jgi:hypothetical protein